ncbi:hypothetical protein ACFONL_04510 [Camelimonas fluminis]|uniref:Uncharacterized protein n=1 Tax=Camelimonas fluminis TaxID=1576911 RepID=A0ABV7UDP8_9HYPH
MANSDRDNGAAAKPAARRSRHQEQTPMLHVALLANYARAQRARLTRWSTLTPTPPK